MDKEKRVRIFELIMWVLLGIVIAGFVLIGIHEERIEREKIVEIVETNTIASTYNYGG